MAVLAACGGEDAKSDAPAPLGAAARPASDAEAVRFLQQASFGATAADIARVKQVGYENWVAEQFAAPRSSHLEFLTSQVPLPIPANTQVSSAPLYYSFWRQAIAAPDQLRQRTAFALSQIIVTSAAEAQLSNDADDAHSLAAYLDILSEHSFGNYREHPRSRCRTFPTMGVYLRTCAIGKPTRDNGRTPDENYAREVMQLFTIGLFELNMDGTQKLVQRRSRSRPTTLEDISQPGEGLHRLELGQPGLRPIRTTPRFGRRQSADPIAARDSSRCSSIRSTTARTPRPSCRPTIAARHQRPGGQRCASRSTRCSRTPTSAPFIGQPVHPAHGDQQPEPGLRARGGAGVCQRQLHHRRHQPHVRQRPCAATCAAVVAATLLHPEARTAPSSTDAGKLREPVLRLGHAAALVRGHVADQQLAHRRHRPPTPRSRRRCRRPRCSTSSARATCRRIPPSPARRAWWRPSFRSRMRYRWPAT
ncbi:MAG: DUF1800 domain-containing protein [Comamonadaceae bacterium]|nr:DUF1800 domain-containing protein [Comamonadaceae bacterium]